MSLACGMGPKDLGWGAGGGTFRTRAEPAGMEVAYGLGQSLKTRGGAWRLWEEPMGQGRS